MKRKMLHRSAEDHCIDLLLIKLLDGNSFEELVDLIVENINSMMPPERMRFRDYLQKNVIIKGFNDPLKAPPTIIKKSIMKSPDAIYHYSYDFMGFFEKMRENEINQLSQFLEELYGYSSSNSSDDLSDSGEYDGVPNTERKSLSYYIIERLEKDQKISTGTAKEIMENHNIYTRLGIIDRLSEIYLKQNINKGKLETHLLLYCLLQINGGQENGSLHSTQDNSKSKICEGAHNRLFESIIEILKNPSLDSNKIKDFENFGNEILNIVVEKRKESDLRLKINEVITEILGDFQEDIIFFGIADLDVWDSLKYPQNNLERINVLFCDIKKLFLESRDYRIPSKNFEEQYKNINQLSIIHTEISDKVEILATILSQSSELELRSSSEDQAEGYNKASIDSIQVDSPIMESQPGEMGKERSSQATQVALSPKIVECDDQSIELTPSDSVSAETKVESRKYILYNSEAVKSNFKQTPVAYERVEEDGLGDFEMLPAKTPAIEITTNLMEGSNETAHDFCEHKVQNEEDSDDFAIANELIMRGCEISSPKEDSGEIIEAEVSNVEESNTHNNSFKEFEYKHFSDENKPQRIAGKILEKGIDNCPDDLDFLIWRLIYDDKIDLAYNISKAFHSSKAEYPFLNPWIIHSLALGRHIRQSSGEMMQALKDDFSNFDTNCFDSSRRKNKNEWNSAIRFFLCSAAFRPAILAPSTGASAVLGELWMRDGLTRLFEYTKTISEYSHRNQPLDLSLLGEVKDHDAWQSDIEMLREEVEQWYSQARSLRMVIAAAIRVWKNWIEKGGIISNLLMPLRRNDESKIDEVRRQIERYSDESEIKRVIDYTDRKLLKRHLGYDIIAGAFNKLKMHLLEAVGYAKRWVALVESRPDSERGYLRKLAESLCTDIKRLSRPALAEISEYRIKYDSIFVQAGASVCKRAIEDIQVLFSPSYRFSSKEENPRHILNGDLLRIPGLKIDNKWIPVIPDRAVIKAIIEYLAAGITDWETAFKANCQFKNHLASERILEFLEHHSEEASPEALNRMKKMREDELLKCREALRRDTIETGKDIENAVSTGLLIESERSVYSNRLSQIEMKIDDIVDFSEYHDLLNSIRKEILSKQRSKIDETRRKLDIFPMNPESKSRISSALDKGDIWTANEFLEMIKSNGKIREEFDSGDSFSIFIEQKFDEIVDFLLSREAEPRRIIDLIKNRGNIPGITMGIIPGAQASNAATMMESWFLAKRLKGTSEENLQLRDAIRGVLDHLGFKTKKISLRKQKNLFWIDIETSIIRDRNQCPISKYGSEAKGEYRILCTWSRPSEEELINEVAEADSSGLPVLVFHFGVLTLKRRRDLASHCKKRRKTFIVLDDALMLYLCGERGSRLPVMFDCTLPFTFFEPYIISSGSIAPEMFYGRQREKNSVIDPMGSCFIYGGRQLGKTAFLKDVERTFHEPGDNRFAFWIDLKVEGIGGNRPIETIWALLADKLKPYDVISSNYSGSKPEKILEKIQVWLTNQPNRRIILLLDEADKFLESDSFKSFEQVDHFKGLMERTDRRFKVVFAGLHNVQRTTRQANQPLAHFGEPICIGPLLNEGEWREALNLIKRPLQSLGYRFQPKDLITRILSQTNYYPSLIQLYCNYLLRHIREVQFDNRTAPPYMITSQNVESAYKSQNLRRAIRDRFMWTLDLDPRYRVLAFTIAFHSISAESGRDEHSFDVDFLMDEALTWWPRGFKDIDKNSFMVLLEEMVGLGILREDIGRYSLRSLNVISLLGTADEIEKELMLSECQEPSPEYEPQTFRAAFSNDTKELSYKRSPLTDFQESMLKDMENGVSLIFGSKASGLDDLEAFLGSSFGKESVLNIRKTLDKSEFKKEISGFNRDKEGISLILVSQDCPWTDSWVKTAFEKVERLKSKTSLLRIAFIADPVIARQLLADRTSLDTFIHRGAKILSLEQWHDTALRQWLDCSCIPNGTEFREKLTQVTGNWPILLYHFHNTDEGGKLRWDKSLTDLQNRMSESRFKSELMTSFGIESMEEGRTLKALCELQGDLGLTCTDLSEVLEDIPIDMIGQILKWAELLRLIKPNAQDRYFADPIVHKLMEDSED